MAYKVQIQGFLKDNHIEELKDFYSQYSNNAETLKKEKKMEKKKEKKKKWQ